MPENEIQHAAPVPPFVTFVTSAVPMVFDNSMSYYEALCALWKWLQDDVIDVINNNASVTDQYITLTNELKSYVENYFDNLDVQQEINNKLDDMAESGELGELMSAYITPIQEAYEARVNSRLDEQDNQISIIDNKVTSATNGSPIPVSSLDDMTNTSKIYVLVSTGKWYYYDGDSWEVGGDYQTPVADFDTTLSASDGIPDSKSVGDRINDTYYVNNLVDTTDVQDGKRYDDQGNIINDNGRVIFNTVIPVKNGDTLVAQELDDGTIKGALIGDIAKVDCYGDFIEFVSFGVSILTYTFTEDCFIRISGFHSEGTNLSDKFFFLNAPSINYLSHKFNNKNSDSIKSIESDLDNNSVQYNYLNNSECFINQNMNASGAIIYSTNGFAVTNLIPVKNGDVVRFYNFNTSGTYNLIQLCKYNANKQFVSRVSVSNNTYTADADGYIMGNVTKPTSATSLGQCAITINREITSYYPYGRVITSSLERKVSIEKVNNRSFLIRFGNFNVNLFKTEDAGANANNWNLKTIKRGDNVLVPEGTDIIGPVRINDNTDFIGGVHGDEFTAHIILNVDGIDYKDNDIQNITSVQCDKLVITLISSVYDQQIGDIAFDRNVIITITDNKIHCSNSYKAKKNLTLKVACVGGLIACRNTIINNITLNNAYYDSAPTTAQSNESPYNTYGLIDTIYGDIVVRNIKGYTNPNYIGYLNVYTNESPMRCKIYFNPYHNGNYSITSGQIISGEFEYLFN